MKAFWAVTCHFNPLGFAIKLENYRRFREALRLPLLAVELSADGRFELQSDDADRLVRVRCDSILWHKENLLNIGFRNLPVECTELCWIDADVIASDPNWPLRVSALLETCRLVQPFSRVWRLSKDQTLAEALAHRGEPIRAGVCNGQLECGFAAAVHLGGLRASNSVGSSGFAWAARRSLLQQVPLFDRMIVGAGDVILAKAAFGLAHQRMAWTSQAMANDACQWGDKFFRAVGGKVGFIDQAIYHLWHGEIEDRKYMERYQLLKDFDPLHDVAYNADGVLEWSGTRPDLQEKIKAYFQGRKEDR